MKTGESGTRSKHTNATCAISDAFSQGAEGAASGTKAVEAAAAAGAGVAAVSPDPPSMTLESAISSSILRYSSMSSASSTPPPAVEASACDTNSNSSLISAMSSMTSSTCSGLMLFICSFSFSVPAFIAATVVAVASACSRLKAICSMVNWLPMSVSRCCSYIFFLFIACIALAFAAGPLPEAMIFFISCSACWIFDSTLEICVSILADAS
mmetsp:Transcript_43208/g.93154  ORF Transcript_43208/g.93154 Transcript_43208/m.93154 type:complete len:211 (-) Transcript_43208:139-771(-)